MKKHTFSESQIVRALKENEGGRSVWDIYFFFSRSQESSLIRWISTARLKHND